MRKMICALALLCIAASVCSGQTFNIWERGYITAPAHACIAASDSVDLSPPVVGGDTLNVRGFMVGYRATTHGQDHSMQVRYREAGSGGWERWDQWLKASPANLGLPLPSRWQGMGGTNGIGSTPMMPIANIKTLRLFNRSAFAAMSVVVLWFMDPQDAKAADWSSWEM